MSASNKSATDNPMPFLRSLVGQRVVVKTKWGPHYAGTLTSCDEYMNLQLADCFEREGSNEPSEIGNVVMRCNNVLYVRQVDQAGDMRSKLF